MADNIYQVTVMRRIQGGQVVLNYTDEERAMLVFHEIAELAQDALKDDRSLSSAFVDDFNAHLILDHDDIGNVYFQDTEKAADLNCRISLVHHRAQQRAQAIAQGGANLIAARAGLALNS
jgi:hypothetical protein